MTNCEITGERLIVWLNTRNDEISKLQNTFTPIELEYFQVLLKEIVVSQERYLVFSICSNLSSTLTAPLSKTDSFKLLSKWIKSGYFVKKDGRVYLGVRTLNEYSSYFHEYCEDYFSTCSLCSEKVFFVSRNYLLNYEIFAVHIIYRVAVVNHVNTFFTSIVYINSCRRNDFAHNVMRFGFRKT